MSTAAKRVVITGMGAITPIGQSVDEFWDAMMRGESGAAPITHFEASDLATRFSCKVKGFDPRRWIGRKLAWRLDVFSQLALAAAQQACADAGIDTGSLPEPERERFGAVFGSGIGGFNTIEQQIEVLKEKGPGKVSPFFVPMIMINAASAMISIEHGLRGPNHCVVSACATGNDNLGDALLLLRHGYADAILTGGPEYIARAGAVGFSSMKAMSRRNDSPETACRPCDLERDGLVPGEGAGALVLETLEHAEARGARIYAELAGFGASADAYHYAAPEPTGQDAVRAIRNALADAGADPGEID